MKIHYINILLFELPLNILVNTHKKSSITPCHTPKIPTTRTLCECELYSPANYDSDPEMKRVMQQFEDRTTQRFQEYDEKLQEKRQICKDTCDKEIQKIILKDKIEKELTEKFSSLHTDIQSDAIPTCICEKTMADKMEKGCLRCGGVLGGGIAPTFGLIGSVAINMWKTTEIAAVIAAAEKFGAAKGAAAGIKEGIKVVMDGLLTDFRLSEVDVKTLGLVFDGTNYNNGPFIYEAINTKLRMSSCVPQVSWFDPDYGTAPDQNFCNWFLNKFVPNGQGSGVVLSRDALKKNVQTMVLQAESTAKAVADSKSAEVAAEITEQHTAVINATYSSYQTVIIASIVAILVIVLVMIIIYLILRYRRKKKMKKKLQYIKLLEE
ncbi:rifin [Plasmodium falciparum IGH-CR14]|uniref:Rifin n=1 Tax=Plasmodium falciparum IGH-CR14 TaxID=580059 RepID=A0A0L1I763_PLAFA|nr:rifin [Plasmodium falciparum IGH-CR14]